MIGVIAKSAEEPAVREFFELFKVPWEFFQEGRAYEVVLCAGDSKLNGVAPKLLLVYAGQQTPFDAVSKIQIHSRWQGAELSLRSSRFPIYGSGVTFAHPGVGGLKEARSGNGVAYLERCGETQVGRIGYDLFSEVEFLLNTGQPAANAGIPTLELHIAFLRGLITHCGIPLLEIPAVPEGHPFIACLTHDIDFASIRRYKLDATMFGFLYRATLGSAFNLGRRRLPLSKLLTNWAAAAKLPFVFLGLARDFWYDFDRDYLEIEKGRPSTYFVIPFSRRPGRRPKGEAPRARGSRYDISHITEKVPRLMAAGCEVGLHGIDAWLESSRGREEARRISEVSATAELGVRMHWLYSDERSPTVLEEAEFSYDSTVGYNETVGYRAGTTQVFKPLQVTRLLELPMHIMDTALFYRGHLNCSPKEAWDFSAPLLENAVRHGGVLTINWHDRSIAPERLWGDFYAALLDDLSAKSAWFSTAAHAVSWFRKRRAAVFERVWRENNTLCARVVSHGGQDLPGLRLRLHHAQKPESAAPWNGSPPTYVDAGLNNTADVRFPN
jgi:hypothetical protein